MGPASDAGTAVAAGAGVAGRAAVGAAAVIGLPHGSSGTFVTTTRGERTV
jgi:hypothetical protein